MKRSLLVIFIMRTILFTLMVVVATSAWSQEFHAAILWNTAGPVKEIKYSKTDFYRNDHTIKFKKNGKYKGHAFPLWYDENGYPVTHTWGEDKTGGVISDKVEYDACQRPTFFAHTCTIVNLNIQQETTHAYEGDSIFPVYTSYKLIQDSNNYILLEYSYSDYKTDDAGNWIQRNVSMKASGVGDTPTVSAAEYTETRSLKYYKQK